MAHSRFFKKTAAFALIGTISAPLVGQETIDPIVDTMSDADTAQIDDDRNTNEIIVEGYTKKQIKTFLWKSLVKTDESVAKRATPICVGIDNISDTLRLPLRNRILANLEEFDIEVAEPDCTANAVVAFHEDAHFFVNLLNDKHYRLFSAMYLPEKRRLIDPIRASYTWHILPTEAARRQPREFFLNFAEARIDSIIADDRGFRSGPASAVPSTQSFTIIDLDAIDGLTVEQLGDYITLRMLVQFEPGNDGAVPADSILRLFSGAVSGPSAPPEMSKLDRAIISEVYSPKRRTFRHGTLRQAITRASVATLDEEGLIIDR